MNVLNQSFANVNSNFEKMFKNRFCGHFIKKI